MTVSNNVKGNNIIKTLRKRMKQSDSSCRVILRGRGYRYGKGNMTKKNNYDNRYQCSLPLSKAAKIAVYVAQRGTNPHRW